MSFKRNFGVAMNRNDRKVMPRTARRLGKFRLRVESLENRELLSVSPTTLTAATTPVAYEVIAPEQSNVGGSETFEVVALDAAGHQAIGYSGTASLAASGAGGAGATLPASITFDHGIDFFQASFAATGTATVTATETDSVVTPAISGSGSTNVNPATVATQLVVLIPGHETPGKPVNVTVEALDAAGHVVPGYTGTVALSTSTDANATLPAAYTFTSADAGKHTFQVTFSTTTGTGLQTVTATDTTNSLTASVSTNLTRPAAATHFAVEIPENVQEGVPTYVTVVALNANNQPVLNYTGTISFAATPSSTVTLPANYTFTDHGWFGDYGAHTFQVTFGATGAQGFTVSDVNSATDNVQPLSVTTNVYAAPTATSLLVIAPENVPTGVAVSVTVEALDASNHVVANYANTNLTLTAAPSSGVTITGPTSPSTIKQGYQVFTVTFTNTGSETLTATDTGPSPTLTAQAVVTAVTPPTHHFPFGFGFGFGFSL